MIASSERRIAASHLNSPGLEFSKTLITARVDPREWEAGAKGHCSGSNVPGLGNAHAYIKALFGKPGPTIVDCEVRKSQVRHLLPGLRSTPGYRVVSFPGMAVRRPGRLRPRRHTGCSACPMVPTETVAKERAVLVAARWPGGVLDDRWHRAEAGAVRAVRRPGRCGAAHHDPALNTSEPPQSGSRDARPRPSPPAPRLPARPLAPRRTPHARRAGEGTGRPYAARALA